MLDINLIINEAEDVQKKLKSRGFLFDYDVIIKLYEERKKLIAVKESIAENKNKLSDKFKEAETDKDKLTIKAESQELESSISKNKKLLEKTEKKLKDILLQIPNIPSSDSPIGEDETANAIIKTWGSPVKSNIEHSSLLSNNGLLDFELGASISKTRFVVMKNEIAKLHRALSTFMITPRLFCASAWP